MSATLRSRGFGTAGFADACRFGGAGLAIGIRAGSLTSGAALWLGVL
jgi:hypothetical protein